jgi:hypothetical protein
MACSLCGSEKQSKFGAEINIHFPGLPGIDKPGVWAFPKLMICLDCGCSLFALSESQLRLLGEGVTAVAKAA